jgi:cytidylate kinase
MAVPAVSENAFHRHLAETILSIGEHGDSIIVGRGANFLLSPRTTLRVRVVAELADRVTVMARDLNVSDQEAQRHILDADRQRRHYIKEHFHVDLASPLCYDLTLNSSRIPVSQCADLIITALEGLQQRLAGRTAVPIAARSGV